MSEIQVLELEIRKITPMKIDSNIDKLEPFIQAVKDKYSDIVFNDDQVKEAEGLRTNLNKLEKRIAEERKKIEKENTPPEIAILKKAEKDVKSLNENIKRQINIFKEKEWEEKQEKIREVIDNIFRENKELKKFFIINQSWQLKKYTIQKIETEIQEQFDNLLKKESFINSQIIACNEEIENKIKFEEVQFLMNEDYDFIMKKLVEIKTERKTTEENIKKRAELEKQRALEEAERQKQLEIEEAKKRAEREVEEKLKKKQEESRKQQPEQTNKNESKSENDVYICIKVSGLSGTAAYALQKIIKEHNLKYVKKDSEELKING